MLTCDFPVDFPRSKKSYSTEEKIAKIISLSQNITQDEKEELDKVNKMDKQDDLGKVMEENDITDNTIMSQRDAIIALSNLLTKEEQDNLGRAMEDIERSKLKLYDDLRAGYECYN